MLLSEKIIIYELIGFGIVILFIWIDELLDIPHTLLGAEKTPVNIIESAIETAVFLLFCILTILLTIRLLTKVKHIEGFFQYCRSCQKIKVENHWVPIDIFLKENSEAELSDTLCTDCMKKRHDKILSGKKGR